MKKRKQPGENFSLKTKKNESAAVMDWINSQSNLMDSIRYLIENEIFVNGIRNLQNFIPAERATPVPPGSSPIGSPASAAGEIATALEEDKKPSVDEEIEEEIDEEDIDSWL